MENFHIPFIDDKCLIPYCYQRLGQRADLMQYIFSFFQNDKTITIPYERLEEYDNWKKYALLLFEGSFSAKRKDAASIKRHWFEQVTFDEKSQILTIFLDEVIFEKLSYLYSTYPSYYDRFNRLVRGYSLNLAIYLVSNNISSGVYEFSAEEFKKLCGLSSEKYPKVAELKRNVVLPVIKELYDVMGWDIIFVRNPNNIVLEIKGVLL